MSLQINQKKEAFLASGGLLRSAGLAVPVAGVSSISKSNYIHQAHHLNRPVMQQHPGRARAAQICVNLRHYRFLQSVPAPVFSACNLVRSPGQNAGVITLKNYAPLENGPQSRLHNFRVGAAGPINLRPVFFSKFYPGNLSPIYCIKAKLKVIVTSGECKEARTAVTFAGVSPINTNQANHLNLPAMSLHPGRARGPHFCMKLRHYKILHRGPAPVFSFGTALALKSGNSSTDGVNVIPAVPFFDFSTTTYAAVIRSVSAYGNSDEKDSLYDSAETFAPRFGFNGLKKAAAQLLTDAVPHFSPFFQTALQISQVTGTASVFSYLTPTNQGTAATNPFCSVTGGTELRLFTKQGQHDDTHYCAAVRAAGSAAGAFVWRKPLRPRFSTYRPNQPYEPPRRMGNATGTRDGFSPGLRTEAAPFLRYTTQKTYAMSPRDTDLSIDEKARDVVNLMYIMLVLICTKALKELRSVGLTDKNVIIRAIMRDMPAWDIGCKSEAEDCAVDYWVDRAEYVDSNSFNLYVTQAEENVLWNIEKKGHKPGRLNVPQQRITVRTDGINMPPFIPLIYLTSLGGKLLLMAFPNEQVDADLSSYDDESVMIETECLLQKLFEKLMDEMDDDDAGCPASDVAHSLYIS